MGQSTGERERVKVALVLGAGGTKGWAHAGAIKVLHEAGVPVDLVVGASAGALIGAVYAGTADAGLTGKVAMSFTPREFTDWFLRGLRVAPDAGAMAARLWRACGRLRFDETPIAYAAVALDIASRSRVIVNEGRVATGIEASIRPPLFGPPARWNGRHLLDGGFQTAVPTDVARDLGAEVVIAVNVGAFMGLPAPLRPCSGAVARALFARKPRTESLSGQVAFMAEFLSRARLRWPRPDVEIRPDMRGVSAFSPWHIQTAMRRGEEAARRALPRIRRLLTAEAATGPATAGS